MHPEGSILSKQYFDSYIAANSNIIGVGRIQKITKLINSVIVHQSQLLHLHFKDRCTFDFIGDSIVEAANGPLKKGPISVGNNMEISNSGLTQVKATEAKYLKESISSA